MRHNVIFEAIPESLYDLNKALMLGEIQTEWESVTYSRKGLLVAVADEQAAFDLVDEVTGDFIDPTAVDTRIVT